MAELSRRDILDVLRDFDDTGGASLELVAWETSSTVEQVRPAWEALAADELVDTAAEDDVLGETMYRLTAAGWEALGLRPPSPLRLPQQRRRA